MYFCMKADRLIAIRFRIEESPNTIVQHRANSHRTVRLGIVQQKECWLAVVKSCKLYAVQCHVNQCLSSARTMLKGRQLKFSGNSKRR